MINIRSGRESDSDAELEHAEKLRQVKAVLEEVPFIQLNLTCFLLLHFLLILIICSCGDCQGGHFSGIYRKVQLKPLKWVNIPKKNGEGEEERPVEALMVLKYGGVLTHAGRKQVTSLQFIL